MLYFILLHNSLSSASEAFDGTYQTNVVVTSEGQCTYIPPGQSFSFSSTTAPHHITLQASSSPPVRLTLLGSHLMTRIANSSLEVGPTMDLT